ncbi:hypothetical protein G5I_10179 [Acromyrmex echinatior]|uniref:Uncharacterized protein n=1 Tax=Acromyrmex echinatior TaxID=103372 RepID=F4WW25_ACREC|nr:hypothetical protein G5I_10179 [Acromyrmex echinatior]
MTVTPETSIVGAIDPRTQRPEELTRLRARISLSRCATQTICTSELANKLANVYQLLQFNSPYMNRYDAPMNFLYFVWSLVEMTRHDTPRYKLEAGQSGLKVPPETETGIEMEQDCGGSLGTNKRPLVTADNSSSK